MRVKVKGFECGKCYELLASNNANFYVHLYFSKKNYVLLEYYSEIEENHINLKMHKSKFKNLIPSFPNNFEIYNSVPEIFFDTMEYIEDLDDDQDWYGDYACENYCCSCCGCSCY